MVFGWFSQRRRQRILAQPFPDEWLEIYPVEPLVNNVRNDGPELVRRLDGGPEPSAAAGSLGL